MKPAFPTQPNLEVIPWGSRELFLYLMFCKAYGVRPAGPYTHLWNPRREDVASRRSGWNSATTLSGLARASGPFPRVARPSQPWALGLNPFGILPALPFPERLPRFF